MKSLSLYLMITLYVAAGINHFIMAEAYVQIVPHFLPFAKSIVYFSGICEIAFGLLLLFRKTRVTAAWLIILLLIAIFPANLQMVFDNRHHFDLHFCLAMVRLPVQLLLIWWAYGFTRKAGLTG